MTHENTSGPPSVRSVLLVAAMPILCLAPFANKAFHLDDTVFLWVARQIHVKPLDFFGFNANWYDRYAPMFVVNKNPPGVSYCIALVTALFGERELPLHVAFLLPAAAVGLGTFVLARRFCARPAWAALACVLTPAFLVSSSNIMSDTLMLALFLWALALWVYGVEARRLSALILAAILIALAALTKYFAVGLIPLLAIYALVRKRGLGWGLFTLLIPMVVLAGYEWYTYRLYGMGMLTEAGDFAMLPDWHKAIWPVTRTITTLGFTGGCLVVVLCYATFLWSLRAWVLALVLALCSLGAALYLDPENTAMAVREGQVRWLFLAQCLLFVAGGLFVVDLAVTDLWRSRDAASLLLFLWVAGVLFFAAAINWTTAGRTILPMAPAVGILLARRIDDRAKTGPKARLGRGALPLIPAACIALGATWADYAAANSARDAAAVLHHTLKDTGAPVFYMGHWGFQFYMDAYGAQSLDFDKPVPFGAIIVVPQNNYSTVNLSEPFARPYFALKLPVCRWLATVRKDVGAAFYCGFGVELPYVFGVTPPEEYRVYIVNGPASTP